jgi:glyoxylase-like metal-dependent hydrolase (beta-lactamase superfamily II)
MCPYGAKLLTGEGGLAEKTTLCAHVLLIEAADSLVLVDTGFGTGDVANPKQLGQPFRALVRPVPSLADTALHQIRALGLDPADVRHIAATHLDVDHAGGLPDFPDAEVHVFRPEMEAAVKPAIQDRLRYISEQMAHGPKWHPHEVEGDSWMGFEAVRVLPGIDPEIVLIPLPGHSRGHSAIAVRDGDGWLMHCGDAYFHRNEMQIPPSAPAGIKFFEAAVGWKIGLRKANQQRLRELRRDHGDEVRMFCAHDLHEFEELSTNAL